MKQLVLSVILSLCMLLKQNGVVGFQTEIDMNTRESCNRDSITISSSSTVYLLRPATRADFKYLDCTLKFKSTRGRNICVSGTDNTKGKTYLCPYRISVYSVKRYFGKTFDCTHGLINAQFHFCSSGTELLVKLDRRGFESMPNLFAEDYDFKLYVADNGNRLYGSTTTTTTQSSWSSWDSNVVYETTKTAVISTGAVVGVVLGILVLLTCFVIICCCCRKSRGFSGNTYQQSQQPAQPIVMHQTTTAGQLASQPQSYPQPPAAYPQPGAYPQYTGGYPQPAAYPQPQQPVMPYVQQPNPAAQPPPTYEDATKMSALHEPSAPPMYEKTSES